jgi:hypothetical protein
MKYLVLLMALSFSLSSLAGEQLYSGKIQSSKKACGLTIVSNTVEEDGIRTFLVRTSFTGNREFTLSNLVRTRKGVMRYVASDIIADNSFTEGATSKERISILVQRTNAKSLIFEKNKKKTICHLRG